MKNYIFISIGSIATALILLTTCSSKKNETENAQNSKSAAAYNGPAVTIKVKQIANELTSPVGMAVANDGNNRLFILEQPGRIRILKNGVVLPVPFLNITAKVDPLNIAYSEKGLLGLAFHPQYKINGRFFVYYSEPSNNKESDHKSIIAEYKVSAINADLAETAERILLEIEEPESNHNGGQLAFGKDGYLYIGVGDGGGAGDKHGVNGNGQNLNNLLGKILRIDVDSSKPYVIPSDNPFVNKNARGEIFAYGLRNPWRFSFDRETGKLFCGDVGQNKYEEIDIVESGKNYGWRVMEGNYCYDADNCDRVGLTYPIYEYPHSVGISITGGYVYHGKEITNLNNAYVYGDWNGKLFCLKEQSDKSWLNYKLLIDEKKSNDINRKLNSFGEDEQGELYLLTQKISGPKDKTGAIYKIEK